MKTNYWIADASGVKAQVIGAEERDRWVKVHGWSETTEPAGAELVWLRNESHGGRQTFSAEAAPQWAGLGWLPSSPPEPADLTKDPTLVDAAVIDFQRSTPTRSAAPAASTKE